MALVTLAQLRTRAQVRADMENSGFVSTAAWGDFINASARELYDVLVEKYEDYFSSTSTLITVAGTEAYALPADFLKLVGVDLQVDTTRWRTLKPFPVRERNVYRNGPVLAPPEYELRYWLRSGFLNLLPVPSQVWTLKLWYVPQMTALVGDADTFDGVNGWEEYVVVDAAIKAVVKEEGDPGALLKAKADLLERLEKASANRDPGAAERVSDVYADEYAPI